MSDAYEAVLSEEKIRSLDEFGYLWGPNGLPIARAIERATIEAFRAKYLPELNLQRCYDIQRHELMRANQRRVELERRLAELTKTE